EAVKTIALAIVPLLALTAAARADPCVTSVSPTFQPVAPGSSVEHVTAFSSTSGQCASQSSFDSRFADVQNQIGNVQSENRDGIAMAMAVGSMNLGGAAAAAGPGKAALGFGFGSYKGNLSLSSGVAYAISKQLSINGGVSTTPTSPHPA